MSLKTWWTQREPRERILLWAAMVVVFAAAVYGLGYKPAWERIEQLRTDTAHQRETHDYLRQAVRQIQALGGAQPQKIGTDPLPLAHFIRQNIHAFPIRHAVSQLEAEGEDAAYIRIQDAAFEPLLAFIHRLRTLTDARVASIRLRKGKTPGAVSGELRLRRVR